MLKFRKTQKGFTLVELLIVVVILGILAAVAIPRFLTTRDKAQTRTCQSNLAAINSATEEWLFIHGTATAPVIADIASDTARFPDGPPKCPANGVYSLDATTHRASCTIHQSLATWSATD
jgi:type IV pilus assembly protein PilA